MNHHENIDPTVVNHLQEDTRSEEQKRFDHDLKESQAIVADISALHREQVDRDSLFMGRNVMRLGTTGEETPSFQTPADVANADQLHAAATERVNDKKAWRKYQERHVFSSRGHYGTSETVE